MRTGTAAAAWIFVALCAFYAASASAKPVIVAHRHEVRALYVIDHIGEAPRGDGDLRPYSSEFEKILGSCWVNAEDLTNIMLWLAEKASYQGARNVTSLMMMQATGRRISWTQRRVCWSTFDLAEGHLEAGDP